MPRDDTSDRDGNETDLEGNETAEPEVVDRSETTITQNIYVDGKGKDNFAVVARSLAGDADVEIGATAAHDAVDTQDG